MPNVSLSHSPDVILNMIRKRFREISKTRRSALSAQPVGCPARRRPKLRAAPGLAAKISRSAGGPTAGGALGGASAGRPLLPPTERRRRQRRRLTHRHRRRRRAQTVRSRRRRRRGAGRRAADHPAAESDTTSTESRGLELESNHIEVMLSKQHTRPVNVSSVLSMYQLLVRLLVR